jgi:RNA polymerase sigma factor (sigma-70 family)
MDSTDSDSALWLEAVAGTQSSFGVIFDRYRRLVFRRAYARVLNVADAEDIVAVVFLEAWRKRDSVRFVDGSLRAWLLVVTVNVTMNRERTNRRYRRLLAKLPPSGPEPDLSIAALERIEVGHLSVELQRALQKLNTQDQQIVELSLIEELPMATVAAALDLPVGTVKSRLSRARKRLRIDLEPHFPAQDGALA